MSNQDNLDAVMRRIEKLLAIANCPGADPNEAAAAAGMAERIMRKYQLDNADIIMASLKRGEDMDAQTVKCTAKTNGTKVKQVPTWAGIMALQVAKFCEVGALKNCSLGNGEVGVRFFGFKADVQMAAWMMEYLVGVVNELSVKFRNTLEYAVGGRQAANSYRSGVSVGIASKLAALVKQREDENKTNVTGKELVVVKQAAIRDKFSNVSGDIFGRKQVSTRVQQSGAAFHQGYKDGHKVDVNVRPLTGNNAPLKLK